MTLIIRKTRRRFSFLLGWTPRWPLRYLGVDLSSLTFELLFGVASIRSQGRILRAISGCSPSMGGDLGGTVGGPLKFEVGTAHANVSSPIFCWNTLYHKKCLHPTYYLSYCFLLFCTNRWTVSSSGASGVWTLVSYGLSLFKFSGDLTTCLLSKRPSRILAGKTEKATRKFCSKMKIFGYGFFVSPKPRAKSPPIPWA